MIRFLILLLIYVVCFGQISFAQQNELENDPDQLEIVIEDEEFVEMTGVFLEEENIAVNDVKPKRLQTHLELGTSFTFSPNNFYGPSFYIAPGLSYLVTPRFILSAGVLVERSNYYFMNLQGSNSDGMLPMTRAFLYAKASYMLTSQLTVSGTVYKLINDVPKLKDSSYPFNYNYQGMSIGLDYKINDSFSIGFHMSTQNGNYNSNALMSPFGDGYVPGF